MTLGKHIELVVTVGARSRLPEIFLILNRELQHTSHRFTRPTPNNRLSRVRSRPRRQIHPAHVVSHFTPKLKVGRRLHQPVIRLFVGATAWLLQLLFRVGVDTLAVFFTESELFGITHGQRIQVLHAVFSRAWGEISPLVFQLASHSVREVLKLLLLADIVASGADAPFAFKMRVVKLFMHGFRWAGENLRLRIIGSCTRILQE